MNKSVEELSRPSTLLYLIALMTEISGPYSYVTMTSRIIHLNCNFTESYTVENHNEVLLPLLRSLDNKKTNRKAHKPDHLKISERLHVLPHEVYGFEIIINCDSFPHQNDRKFQFVTADPALQCPRFLMVSELE